MRLPLLLTFALAAPAFAAEPAKAPESPAVETVRPNRPECLRDFGVERLDDKSKTPVVRRLVDLPPANHERTVLRSIDGCPAPVIVRFGVDAPAERPAAKTR